MQIKPLFFALLTFFTLHLKAQTPHLKGKVEIIMSTGQITADFTLSNLPNLGKDYQILLNKGFNIKAIKDSTQQSLKYTGYYNGKMRGEGIVYIPQDKNDVLVNPRHLNISYTGAFPIYNGDYNFTDFKGLIAFNGQTLRAAEQSKWYPIIYDVKNDQLIEQVTFDITVSCKEASQIFVNGDMPKPGPIAQFTSTVAIAPLLFVGNYPIQKTNNALFLNTNMNSGQLAIFEANISEIKQYFNKVLGIPYTTKNVFIEHTAIEKFNKGRIWGFASYPTIALAGSNLGETIDEVNKKFKDSTDYPFYAHEIAHYYFGNVLQPNSTLFWFLLESTAEYLSIKASETKFGQSYSSNYYKNAVSNLKEFKVVPLNKVTEINQINGTYRYSYGPLLLRGLEQTVGEKKTFAFLKQCLHTKGQATNYDFLKEQALKSGIDQKEWDNFEKTFVESENVTSLIKY
ncbi:M1 family aminopeptidase [Pedobacter sp. ASV28]|uniref:M1 family aminopeptidase n=1 Tax=Pedobacter sp. ASV28 TaxID=2795123 RepID=UPI0018EBB933|nr:M1 family aminopeptidase [Pedobacter sp. ASV28]